MANQTKKELESFAKITKVFKKCESIEQVVSKAGVCRATVENFLAYTGQELRPKDFQKRSRLCDKHYYEDISGKELMRKTGLPYNFAMNWLVSKRRGSISNSKKIDRCYKEGMTAFRLAELTCMPYGSVYLWMCKNGLAKKYPKPDSLSPEVQLKKQLAKSNADLNNKEKTKFLKNNCKIR